MRTFLKAHVTEFDDYYGASINECPLHFYEAVDGNLCVRSTTQQWWAGQRTVTPVHKSYAPTDLSTALQDLHEASDLYTQVDAELLLRAMQIFYARECVTELSATPRSLSTATDVTDMLEGAPGRALWLAADIGDRIYDWILATR
jgi:hypothetical protein